MAIFAHAMTLGVISSEAAKSPTKTAIQSGSAALQAGAYQSAVDQFTKALAAKSLDSKTTAITLLNRGLANQQLGEFVSAIADYDRALQERELDKKTRAVALYNRGLANRKLYKTTLALEDFTSALLLNPTFAQAFNSRANVLRELGYYTTAIQDYDAAVTHKHPKSHIPLYGKALSHAAIRNLAAAKDALTKALHIKPAYRPARQLLARITKVPQQKQRDQADTMVVENQTDRIITGSIDDQTTTVVEKNNLPWAPAPAPAPKGIIKPADIPEKKPGQLLITDNETAESIIASASITPLTNQDVFASPTSAPADQVTQNVVSADNAEDPSLRAQILPGKTVLFVPGPGAQVEQPEAQTPVSETTNNPKNLEVAALDPAQNQQDPVQPVMTDGYQIQISAQTDLDVARNLWNTVSEKHSDILGSLTPYIIKVQISGKGTIYRVRAGGFGDRAAGSKLCSRLKRRRVTCYVTTASK